MLVAHSLEEVRTEGSGTATVLKIVTCAQNCDLRSITEFQPCKLSIPATIPILPSLYLLVTGMPVSTTTEDLKDGTDYCNGVGSAGE